MSLRFLPFAVVAVLAACSHADASQVNAAPASTPASPPPAQTQAATKPCADASIIAEAQQRSAKASIGGRRALKDVWTSEAAVSRLSAATETVAEIETAITALAHDPKAKPGQIRERLAELSGKLVIATQELVLAQQQARESLFAAENGYVDTFGPSSELARDADAYDGACAEGDAQSCIRRAQLLEHGGFVAKDLAAAAGQYARACALGSAYACMRHGALLSANGDAAGARASLERGCEQNEPRACRMLARDLEVGRGGPADVPRAAELNQRACVSDVPDACVALALQRLEGAGVTKNFDQAQTLLELACDGGDPFGCTQLGVLLTSGKGVAIDKPRARQAFDRACLGGDANACELRTKL